MSLKRNLLLLAAYFGVLTFMAMPFMFIENSGPPAKLAQVIESSR